MKHSKIKAAEDQPRSIASINFHEDRALFDEDSRYRRELMRVSSEHDERVAAIKADHFNKRQAHLSEIMECAA